MVVLVAVEALVVIDRELFQHLDRGLRRRTAARIGPEAGFAAKPCLVVPVRPTRAERPDSRGNPAPGGFRDPIRQSRHPWASRVRPGVGPVPRQHRQVRGWPSDPPQHDGRRALLPPGARTRRHPLPGLVRAAGSRRPIGEAFQAAKNEAGLDHYQVRFHRGRYWHTTLEMAAAACFTALRATCRDLGNAEPAAISSSSVRTRSGVCSAELSTPPTTTSDTFCTAHIGADGSSDDPVSATTTAEATHPRNRRCSTKRPCAAPSCSAAPPTRPPAGPPTRPSHTARPCCPNSMR